MTQQLTLEDIKQPENDGLPPTQDLGELIREEHCRAELQRLEMGYAGCGCDLCRGLYRTLDLTKYGKRVTQYGDVVLIAEKSSQTDYWTADGAAFVHFGKRYGVGKTGATFCFGDNKDTSDSPQPTPLALPDNGEPVTKLGGGNLTTPYSSNSR